MLGKLFSVCKYKVSIKDETYIIYANNLYDLDKIIKSILLPDETNLNISKIFISNNNSILRKGKIYHINEWKYER